MTLSVSFVISCKRMIAILCRKRFAGCKFGDDFIKQFFVELSFTGEFQISQKLT